jgi:hypothetical protein
MSKNPVFNFPSFFVKISITEYPKNLRSSFLLVFPNNSTNKKIFFSP